MLGPAIGAKSEVMRRIREDYGDFFELVDPKDLVEVLGISTVIADMSTTLRQKLPGLVSGDAEAVIAKRCGLHTSKPVRLWDIGYILFNFARKQFEAGMQTVLLALDSAVPFPARALTRIPRVAKSSTPIADIDARIAEVETAVSRLHAAVLTGRVDESLLHDTVDSDCLELIAFDGSKSLFQQLVLLSTVGVALHEGVRTNRLFIMGIQRKLQGDAASIIKANGWGSVSNDVLTLSNTHPWCEKTGLLSSHCTLHEQDNAYVVSPDILQALVYQEAQYFPVMIKGCSALLSVRGVDTSLEKDFLGPAIFGPGGFAAANGIESSTSCFFTGGDVDCYASAVLKMMMGRWPKDLLLSTTTMHTYGKTGGQFEIVHDLHQLAELTVPHLTAFIAGCDYQTGFAGLGHRSALKQDVLSKFWWEDDMLMYNGTLMVSFDNTSDLTTAVLVRKNAFHGWLQAVLRGSRISRTEQDKMLSESSVTTAKERFQWYFGYLLNGDTTLWHHTKPYPLCKALVCGSRTWVLPENEDGQILKNAWEEVERTMPSAVTREDPLQRHAIPMQVSKLNLSLGKRLFG